MITSAMSDSTITPEDEQLLDKLALSTTSVSVGKIHCEEALFRFTPHLLDNQKNLTVSLFTFDRPTVISQIELKSIKASHLPPFAVLSIDLELDGKSIGHQRHLHVNDGKPLVFHGVPVIDILCPDVYLYPTIGQIQVKKDQRLSATVRLVDRGPGEDWKEWMTDYGKRTVGLFTQIVLYYQ